MRRQRCLRILCLKNKLTGPKLRTVKFFFLEYPHSSLSHLISLYKLKNDSQCESFCVVELELTGPKLRTVKFCFPEYPHSSLSHLISLYKLKNDSHCESFCVVEFAIAEIASTSRNVRRTFHVPSVVPVQ